MLYTPFFNTGGAAFRSVRCVKVQGTVKNKDGRWTQTYSLTFQVVASENLSSVLFTSIGGLKSAPLEDIEVRLGFYPRVGNTCTADATVGIQVVSGTPTMIQINAKIVRNWRKDEDYSQHFNDFTPWLEQSGALVLRPRRCENTIDMFEDGKIPPLTVHSSHEESFECAETGDKLLNVLLWEDGYDPAGEEPEIFVGSRENDDE